MSIHNVTPTSFDHRCSHGTCQEAEQGIAHSRLILQEPLPGLPSVTYQCAAGHYECFNLDLTEAEETSPTRDEFSREQVRNIRQLQKHLNLPVK